MATTIPGEQRGGVSFWVVCVEQGRFELHGMVCLSIVRRQHFFPLALLCDAGHCWKVLVQPSIILLTPETSSCLLRRVLK